MATKGTNRRRIWFLLCGICLATVFGCADMPGWVPFQGPVSDQVQGVVAPYERMAELRELASSADKRSPAEKEKIARQLAESIRKERDPLIRAEIIATLAHFPGATADAILKAGLNDTDTQVRIAACRYWGKRNDGQSIALLSDALRGDVDVDVRLAAVKALGATRNQAAAGSLGEALEDADPAIQYRAALALENITGKDFDGNVHLWRQYVKGEIAEPKPSLADRFRRLF